MNNPTAADSIYRAPVDQLLNLGRPNGHDFAMDYTTLGIDTDQIPELLRMVQDEALHRAPGTGSLVWAPVHAWRALAALKAEQAIGPFLGLLPRIGKYNDDWVSAEVPRALGQIGQAVLEPVTAFLADAVHDEWARAAAARALAELGTRHPDLRGECVSRLSAQLEKSAGQFAGLNAFLVSALLDLKAREALPVMARAFAAGHVDEAVAGDYEDVEIELGAKSHRQHPRKPNQLTELGSKLRAIADANPPGDDIPSELSGSDHPQPCVKTAKTGRNDSCPCGSGKKFKKCCGKG